METTVLEMFFEDAYGGTAKLSIDNPRPDLIPSEVQNAMQNIISLNLFSTKNGPITTIKGAQVVTKTITDVEV